MRDGVHKRLHIFHLSGVFYSPDIYTRLRGATAFGISFRKAQVFSTHEMIKIYYPKEGGHHVDEAVHFRYMGRLVTPDM